MTDTDGVVRVCGPGAYRIAYRAVLDAQLRGLACALVDEIHRFDGDEAAAAGVDVGELVVAQAATGRQGDLIAAAMAETLGAQLIVRVVRPTLTAL